MMRTTALLLALLAAACDKGGSKQEDKGGPTPGPGPSGGPGTSDGPTQAPANLRVAFGDCAAADARFESGPNPEPAGVATARAAPVEVKPGTGWGTIGTGRYGTISGPDHGSGDGYGVGGGSHGRLGRPSYNVPQVQIGTPTSTGDLDKNVIRRYLRRQLPRIKYCYEKQLLAKPRLQGTVETTFVIGSNGAVTQSTAKGVDPEVSACIADVIKSIQFPKPLSGGMVQVKYPFKFLPGEGYVDVDKQKREAAERRERAAREAAEQAKAAAAAEAAARAEAEAKAKAEAEAKAAEAAKEAPVAAEVMEPPSQGILGRPPEPGQDNPLRAQTPAIQKCLADAGQPHGALVVDLTVADGGVITAGATHGVNDKAAACISKAAAAAKWATATAGAYRCPLAFGTQSADTATGVDITTDAVKLGTEELAKVPEIVADTSPAWKINPLYDRLSAGAGKPSEEIIAITGPTLIRPVDAAPMKVVNRVLATAAAADVDVLLASFRGGVWRPLRPLELPVVPVVRGTGDRREAEQPPGEERVIASILITPDALWLGLSRLGEVMKVPKTGAEHDWAALAKLLAEKKQSPFFVDRQDIEIGAEGTVVYRDVVAAIEMCNTTGFAGWTVTPPEALSVKFAQ